MRSILLILLTGLFVAPLHAQEMVFSTKTAAKKVGKQDPFEVRYSIQNASNMQRFSLPSLPDFDIVGGPMQSQSTSYVNGERSSSLDITYVLRAKRTGNLIIPGGIAQIEGKQYRSNDVGIEVIEGSVLPQPQARQQRRNPFDDPFFDEDPFGEDPFTAMRQQHQQMMQQLQQMQRALGSPSRTMPQRSPSASSKPSELITKEEIKDNIFIRVEVDKKDVVLGEQVTAVYKLYTRLPMEVNLTKLPSLNGFWSQDFNIPQPPKPSREILDGKEYQVFILKKSALFPTQTGTLKLDPAEAEGIVKILNKKQVKQDDAFGGMFGGMFADQYTSSYGYQDEPVALKSTAVPINVRDVPQENKLASFNGAVGNYQIESDIDKTEITTDESAVITLRISGSGNLKLIGNPEINFPEDLDTYDPEIRDTITNTSNMIAGYKTFTYTVSPRIAGSFTIPPTAFTFYDPATHSFKTLNTPSYTLHVKPGKEGTSVTKGLSLKDIHDIASKPANIHVISNTTLYQHPVYWSGFAVPLLAYLGLVVYKRREKTLEENTVLFRHKRANKVALKRLSAAESYLKQSFQRSFYEETSKAVWLYLSDKMNIPLSSLSKELAEEKLTAKRVPQSTKDEIFRITTECEMALYSPDSGTLKMHQTYSDTLRLIGQLEELLA
jgi:hypothetical protein